MRLLVEPSSLQTAFLQARTELLEQTRYLDWASLQLYAREDDGGLDTRRRVEIDGLTRGQPEALERFQVLLAAFVEARLLVRGEEGGVSTIEVAHEALIRKWERLRAWVLEDRGRLQELQELRASLEEGRG